MNVRQRAPDAAGAGFSTISSEPAYARAAPAGEAPQPAGFGGLTDTGRRHDGGGGKGHGTEWDAEAIVWKVRQLAQPKNRVKLYAVVAALALVLVLGCAWAFSGSAEEDLEARVEAATQVVKPPVVDNTALITGCVSTCRTRIACDPACREYRARSPRPTVWNACRAGCQNIASKVCYEACEMALAGDNPAQRCSQTVRRRCPRLCENFRAMLPRPTLFDTCEEGCERTAATGCEQGIRAMEHMRELAAAESFASEM